MHHYRNTKKHYATLNKTSAELGGCSFCTSAKDEQIITENDSMYVVANRVAYDIFEGYDVADHLMIIPKEHRTSMADFTREENQDYMELAGGYERRGYSVYARGFGSPSRSVDHQHTHLIKLTGAAPKVILSLAKPTFLFKK